MVRKERPVAVFAPAIREIKLYASGRIDYKGKSGSVIGATARIERYGDRRRFRDTREVVLRIDGPNVAIAATLPVNALQVLRRAEEFVAEVNQMSSEIDGLAAGPAVHPAADPPIAFDRSMQLDTSVPAGADAYGSPPPPMDALIGQLERLGKLRDSGVLTEDEFQVQKAALLRATHK